jgi:hypothetical protein
MVSSFLMQANPSWCQPSFVPQKSATMAPFPMVEMT